MNEPRDLASILDRAKKVRDACKVAANAAALKDKGGWISDDASALDTAITNVGNIDKAQLASITVEIAGTDDRNTAANTLYDNVLTIQNAANIEWPERKEENRSMRESFRFGNFPPRNNRPANNKKPGASSDNGGAGKPKPEVAAVAS